MHDWTRRGLCLAVIVAAVVGADRAQGQAWNYPSFQGPLVVSREFNFALAYGGDGGTDVFAQWREGLDARNQLEVEGGFISPRFGNARGLIGGSYAYQIATETPELPVDLLLTAGLYDSFGDGNFFRLPVGVSVGHRFPIDTAISITPYVHPRVSLDASGCCDKIGLEFDVGANFQLTQQFAVRVSGTFGGSDVAPNDAGFGIGVAWTPKGLRGARGQ
jgi:hypothetical protein